MVLFSSCSASKKAVYKEDRKTVKEYEEKLYGTAEKEKEKEEAIIMPEAVDVSDYTPDWYKRKEEAKEKEEGKPAASLSEQETRSRMVGFGRAFLGVPYLYGGNSPKKGFDCSGLVCHIYSEFGVALPRTSSQQSKEGKRIKLEHAQPGDLVFFGHKGKTNHVALVVERKGTDLVVLHSTSRGVQIDNVTQSSYWKNKIIQARRIL